MQESIDWSEPFEFVTKYAVDHKVDAAVQCHLNHGQIQIRIQILIQIQILAQIQYSKEFYI